MHFIQWTLKQNRGHRHIAFMKKELNEKPAPEVVEALSKLK
jgi:hypothetical protein